MATKKTEEKDLFELIQNLLKNWFIVLPCVVFAVAMGVFVALWIRPVYQVDALLQIETKNGKGNALMGDMAALFTTTSPAETEIELIKSRRVLGSTVESMRLQYYAIPKGKWDRLFHREGRMELMNFEVPWSNLPLEEKEKPWVARVLDSVNFALYDHNGQRVLVGVAGQTYHFPYAGDSATFGIYRMDARKGQRFDVGKMTYLDAVEKFRKSFEVTEKGKRTGILEFSYQDVYPDRAADVLNEVATSYLRQNVEERNAEAQQTLEFLEKQLPDLMVSKMYLSIC